MNTLDDEGDDFHPTHESHSHLSQIEWDAVERLSSTIGQEAVGAMLSALGPDGQHATIAKFIQNGFDAEPKKVALIHQQGSQQTEMWDNRVLNTSICWDSSRLLLPGRHTRQPESLKIDISKYKGADEDSLLRWFVELDDAVRAHHVVDEKMQITFAQSNLAGRAKTWALGLKLHDPYVLGH